MSLPRKFARKIGTFDDYFDYDNPPRILLFNDYKLYAVPCHNFKEYFEVCPEIKNAYRFNELARRDVSIYLDIIPSRLHYFCPEKFMDECEVKIGTNLFEVMGYYRFHCNVFHPEYYDDADEFMSGYRDEEFDPIFNDDDELFMFGKYEYEYTKDWRRKLMNEHIYDFKVQYQPLKERFLD